MELERDVKRGRRDPRKLPTKKSVKNRADSRRSLRRSDGSRKRRSSKHRASKKSHSKAGDMDGSMIGTGDEHGEVVSLRNTLELFGDPKFSISSFIEDKFGARGRSAPGRQQSVLQTRRVLLKESLKGFVTDNYGQFIHTAKEIQYIESDMSQLYNLISSYKTTIKKMQDNTIDIESQIEKDQDVMISPSATLNDNKSGQEVQLLEELVEDLGARIYEHKFEQAVSVIETVWEKMTELDMDNIGPAQAEFNTRVEKLTSLITEKLEMQKLKTNERRQLIQLLIRLGRANKALSIFLSHRESEVMNQVSKIQLQGDLSAYITDLSGIVFSAINSLCVEFRHLFKERSAMSVFLAWAVRELNQFAVIFQRHVFQPDTPFRSVCQCIHTSIVASKLLERSGLRFSFVIEELFLDDIRRAFYRYMSQIRRSISKSVAEDSWKIEQAWVTKNSNDDSKPFKLSITKSARFLYDTVHQYMLDMNLVIFNPDIFLPTINDLLSSAVSGTRQLFEEYLLQMTSASKSTDISDLQGISIVANSYYLAEDLFPRIRKELESRLEQHHGMREIKSFQDQLLKFYRAQRDFYCQKRGKAWLTDIIQWNKNCFQWYTVESASAPHEPSRGFVEFERYLDWMLKIVKQCLKEDVAVRMRSRAVAEVFSLLRNSNALQGTKLSANGKKQLIFDIRFTQKLGAGHYQDSIASYCSNISERFALSNMG